MFIYLKKWIRIYGYFPQSLTLNNLYNRGIEKMESISYRLTNRYMTGSIRDLFSLYIRVYDSNVGWGYLAVEWYISLILQMMHQLVCMKVD